MTKRAAIKRFNAEVRPQVLVKYGPKDKPAMAEAWNTWTDALCKNGEITDKQYNTWTYP